MNGGFITMSANRMLNNNKTRLLGSILGSRKYVRWRTEMGLNCPLLEFPFGFFHF